jgi:membrane protease subunit (stomatin/prohibitin family)
MSLWDTLKGHAGAQLLDVLEWTDDSRDAVVFRFPIFQKAIQDGGKLVVREGQVAVFVSEGKLSDVFPAGTHDINTRNAPIMSFFESIKYGLNMPYKGDVYFVNTRVFADQKWGTPNPIPIRDADLGVVRIRGFGSFAFRVSDPAVFLREVVGTAGLLTTEDITGQLKRKLVSALADTIGEAKIPLLDLVAHYMDFGDALRDRLNGWFKENYGILLTDFVVENISVPPEVEKMMDKRSSMALAGDMSAYTQFQAANALEDAAKSPGGGGGFMQAGLGLAMGQTMANQLSHAGQGAAPFNPQQGLAGAPPPLPPPLPTEVVFHHAGPDGARSQLAAADIAARVRSQPGRHLVWKEGMANWAEAAAVPEIAALLRGEPPPLPPG